MKKTFLLLIISSLCVLSLNAKTCQIISSPAMNNNDVIGTDAVAMSISKVYFDKNKKIKVKNYSSAFLEFNNKARDYIKKDCKKYKIKKIYNYKINSIIDKDYYHFNATYDFSNVE